ncbi:MAG: hypothetical protein COV10_02085 [Candidatus Vogelbacteria bacterium CG10_big_fil_rev_8_21_14_0_10_51_16]|uniref:Uncharacterized protein n=1 Tax=Candidatus Vogelbacteria bacterium CG10_big_fil_rev_8_21_14_0_10_51_16 TaxID=1975045 RepID=A0A2H0RG22_9BACT|nr:MAG: hypothetical protein COV10_02085 [Candidatus Vogelbacteria bacterium CG10_big_fil_rev_8_21_14_0_10_51_16]
MANHREKKILVVFEKRFPVNCVKKGNFSTIVGDEVFKETVESFGCTFVELRTLVDHGSLYKSGNLIDELSKITLSNGTRITKSFVYKGYELWWLHYNSLFYFFCVPYMRYKRLLERLKDFHEIYLYDVPHKTLFSYYLKSYSRYVRILPESRFGSLKVIPLGIFIQIVLTLLSLIILVVTRRSVLVFIGDKFEKDKDYDYRMKFVYKELRGRDIPFVEFIRSLESWRTVLQNALTRKRPVIYSGAIAFVARFFSTISDQCTDLKSELNKHSLSLADKPEEMFKFLMATHYFLNTSDDVWAIRIMKFILRLIGVKAAFITAALDRNFHTVFGCKLNGIPTVGIMHGVPSRYSTPYDYLTGFDGEKMLSVDTYGVWSEWWRTQYIEKSNAYNPEQLHVSGPMRPLVIQNQTGVNPSTYSGSLRVLFIAEQLSVPEEVIPYLLKLMERTDIKLTIKFRPFRDGFEGWLLKNEPGILKQSRMQIVKGNMQDAIRTADVVVGCHSTAVLEALLQLKVPIFLRTQKWGDYYNMSESSERLCFLASDPKELIERIKQASSIDPELLRNLREQYFGDLYKNGSKWVVDRLEKILETKKK